MENNTLYLIPNSGYNYMVEDAHNTYIENKIEQENRLVNAIKESLILAESAPINTKLKKINILYEAQLSDNIKNKYQKVIAAIENLFKTFMLNLSKILTGQQVYLKKYEDMIKNTDGKEDIPISYLGDYFIGIKRIQDTKLKPFDWSSMKDMLSSEDQTAIIENLMGVDFKYNKEEDLRKQLKDYFIAAEKGEQKTNMKNFMNSHAKEIFDFCYNYKNIERNTKEDINVLKSASNKIQNTVDTTQDSSASTSVATQSSASTVQKTESSIDVGLYKYIVEADSNDETTDDKDKQNTNGTSLNIDTSNVSKEENGNKNNNVNAAINNYLTIARSIITAKWTAYEQISRDFIAIIKAHVKSNGGEEAENKEQSKKEETK